MTKRIVSKPKNRAAFARQQKLAQNLAAIAAKNAEKARQAGLALKRSKAG